MFIAAWSWYSFWLFVHILLVIVAFGPTFAFPLIGVMGQKNPKHAAFAVELTEFISRRLSLPLAALVPFAGLALIYTGKHQLWQSEWLIISIVLFTILFFFALFVQLPAGGKLLRAIQSMPPPAQAMPGGELPPASAPRPAGPPPEIARLGKRVQLGGMFLTVLVLTILLLMVWQPGACQGGC